MSSRDEQWWDLQAGEYVLGTLSKTDLAVFIKLLRTDPDVQRRVREWESRLDPLNQSTHWVEPSPHLFNDIIARLNLNTVVAQSTQSNLVSLTKWRKQVRFWQSATVATFAIAATIVGFLVFNPIQLLPLDAPPQSSDTRISTVSVLVNENGEPVWAVNLHRLKPRSDGQGNPEPDVGELVISVVGQIPLADDQSHQLWMVLADGSGVQSVGLMPDKPGESRTLALPLALSQAEAFAVSLEPFGGVIGPEHGPIVAINPIVPPSDSI